MIYALTVFPYCLLLPETGRMGAGSRARRIHENLGKARVTTNDSQSGRLLLCYSKNAALNYQAKEERQKQITEIIADKIADQENSPEEILINEELFPTMSKHWTVYRKNAGRYLSAYGKKNKAMHKSLKN